MFHNFFRPRLTPDCRRIAQGFATYLDEHQLKKTMRKTELRDIYNNDFSKTYETDGVSFRSALNEMCFHLNLCQQIRGKVVFGGGDAAAEFMFDSDDDEEWERESKECSFPCDVCRKPLPNCRALERHKSSINHRQQIIFKKIRETLEKYV